MYLPASSSVTLLNSYPKFYTLKNRREFPLVHLCLAFLVGLQALLTILFSSVIFKMLCLLSLILPLPVFWFQYIWFPVLKWYISVDWHSTLSDMLPLVNFNNIPSMPAWCLIGWSILLPSCTTGPDMTVFVISEMLSIRLVNSFPEDTLRSILLGSQTAGFYFCSWSLLCMFCKTEQYRFLINFLCTIFTSWMLSDINKPICSV